MTIKLLPYLDLIAPMEEEEEEEEEEARKIPKARADEPRWKVR